MVQATLIGMELVLHQLNVSKREALLLVPVLAGKSTIQYGAKTFFKVAFKFLLPISQDILQTFNR